MDQLNPSDLLIFARIAELGSFNRAAARIGLPKATVSRRISRLEEVLGERLIVRTTRRLNFTEFGTQLLEHARQVASEIDSVIALSEHRHAQPTGRLRVSMPSDIASLLLHDMLATFVASHPAISLEVDLSPRRVDLLAESFDIALRVGVLQDDALLTARRLTDLSYGLYAAPTYLEKNGGPAVPSDLMQHKCAHLLGRNSDKVGWTLTRDSDIWDGMPSGQFAANSPELLVRMACSGCGIVAVPDRFVHPHVRAGELRRVLTDWRLPSESIWAVFAGRRLMPTKTRAFIDMLQLALEDKPGST